MRRRKFEARESQTGVSRKKKFKLCKRIELSCRRKREQEEANNRNLTLKCILIRNFLPIISPPTRLRLSSVICIDNLLTVMIVVAA